MKWALLGVAIVLETAGTMSLRMAVHGPKRWFAAVAIAEGSSFAVFSVALSEGLALGVAYGIWAAAGVALTAIGSHLFFKEPLTRVMTLGIFILINGVLLVEIGAGH